MTPKQRAKLLAFYLPYLDNNFPKQGKARKSAERAIMVGAYAYAQAVAPDGENNAEPHLGILLLSGRLLSEESKPTS